MEYAGHIFFLSSYVFNFFFFLVFGLLFYLDLFLLHGTLFRSLARLYDALPFMMFEWTRATLNSYCFNLVSSIHQSVPSCFFQSTGGTLFVHSIQITLFVSIIQSVYYYMRYGALHDYTISTNFYFYGYLIPILIQLMTGCLVLAAFILGGSILIVFYPVKLGFSNIPIFFIMQVILNAGTFQLIASCLTSLCKSIFPYHLHSGRENKKYDQ